MGATARVKICGLTRPEDLTAVVAAKAAYGGFNFVERSKRFVPLEMARTLAIAAPPGLIKVALTLDASDAEIDRILDHAPMDMLQLHGDEPPERVRAVKARWGLPVMKAVGVATAEDLGLLDRYADVADQLLVDTKAPQDALPGGTGQSFDWSLIAGRRWPVPWMLAGGLTPANVAQARQATGAVQVDVASGVESPPGVKNPDLIAQFVAAAG